MQPGQIVRGGRCVIEVHICVHLLPFFCVTNPVACIQQVLNKLESKECFSNLLKFSKQADPSWMCDIVCSLTSVGDLGLFSDLCVNNAVNLLE